MVGGRRSVVHDNGPLNTGIPRIAVFGSLRALSFTPVFCSVGHGEGRNIFQVLVTNLTFDTQTDGRAVWNREFLTVHAVSEQRLGMKRIRQIEAVPPSVNSVQKNQPGLRKNTCGIRVTPRRYAFQLSVRGPALFENVLGNLRGGRKPLQFRKGEFIRARNKSVHRKPPLLESTSHVASVIVVLGQGRVDRREIFRDFASVEFPSQRLAREENAMGGIGESFSAPDQTAVGGGNEAVTLREKAGHARRRSRHGCADSGCNKSASRKGTAHKLSFTGTSWPVVMPRIRLLKPARYTITT